MAGQSTHNSTLEEIEIYFNQEDSRQIVESPTEAPCTYIQIYD